MPSSGITSIQSLIEAEIPLNSTENLVNLELQF